jgi:hypothetical protein
MAVRVPVVLASLALLGAAPLSAEVDVQLRNGRVDVRCSAAPLVEVLDRMARATGMKLVQQGVTPSMLLSLRLEDRTPAEAVFGVLEGLGLNYAFVLDATGTRIDTLILAGAAGAKATVASAAPPPAVAAAQRYVPRREAPPAAGPDEAEELPEEEPFEEPVEEDEAEEPPEGAAGAAGAAAPRGNVLQPPALPVFPSSPFAPRAPMFVPQAEPDPAEKVAPPPKPD